MRTALFFIPFLLLAFISIRCNSLSGNDSRDSLYMDYDHQVVPFKFYAPDDEFDLAGELKEISGLAWTGEHLGAVEDENGIVYFLDPNNGEILRQLKFGEEGDYEGIEMVGEMIYVINSKGEIFSFENTGSDKVDANKKNTELSGKNDVEGLTSHGKNLLIACKGDAGIEGSKLKGKAIYPYNIEEEHLLVKDGFGLLQEDIENFLKNKQHFNRTGKFEPTAIAIHPTTGDFYVLSSTKALLVLSGDFRIKEAIQLKSALFLQPEGICFSNNGTLFISSEGGKGRSGKLFRFVPQ